MKRGVLLITLALPLLGLLPTDLPASAAGRKDSKEEAAEEQAKAELRRIQQLLRKGPGAEELLLGMVAKARCTNGPCKGDVRCADKWTEARDNLLKCLDVEYCDEGPCRPLAHSRCQIKLQCPVTTLPASTK